MADTSPRLGLPFLVVGQADKEGTYNDAMLALDVFLDGAVLSRTTSIAPGSAAEGDAYLLPIGPAGAWTGRGGKLAAWQGGGWRYYTPKVGSTLYVISESMTIRYNGAAWVNAFTTVSNDAPQALGTAAAGTSLEASRADHVHEMPTLADVGAAAASHTHPSSDITDFSSAVRTEVHGALVEGDGITLAYDAGTHTTTIASTATGGTVAVKKDGASVLATATKLNFVGAGVTAAVNGTDPDMVDVTIAGGGGGGGGGGTGGGGVVIDHPALSTLTIFNPISGTTWTDVADGPLSVVANCQPGNKIQAALKAVPSTNWRATLTFTDSDPTMNFFSVGLTLCRSSDGALQLFHRSQSNNTLLAWQNFNNAVAFSGQVNARNYFKGNYPMGLRIDKVGSTYSCYAQETDQSPWHFVFSISTAFMTADQVGPGINPQDYAGQGDLILEADFYTFTLEALA